MDKRTKRQENQVWKWIREYGGKAVLIAITGYGKTNVALKAIQISNSKSLDRIIHVIVPTTNLKQQWEKQIKEWKLKGVEVFVINSYLKKARICDLLIPDECHRYASMDAEYFPRLLDQTDYKWVLCLSATLSSEELAFLNDRGIGVVDTVTQQEALEEGYVSNFSIYNLGIKLDKQSRYDMDDLNERFGKLFSIFDNDFSTVKSCLNKEMPIYKRNERGEILYDEDGNKIIEKWVTNPNLVRIAENMSKDTDTKVIPDHIYIAAINFFRVIKQRKEILYKVQSKLYTVTNLIKRFTDQKILTFGQLTETADYLTDQFDGEAVTYHSRMTKKQREKALKKLSDGRTKVRIINSAKALDEGLDVPDLSVGIIYAFTSTPRTFIQRMGRIIRQQEGKHATIVVVYCKDTQDLSWLRKMQSKTDRTRIKWVDSIESIFNNQEVLI